MNDLIYLTSGYLGIIFYAFLYIENISNFKLCVWVIKKDREGLQ